MLKKCRQIKAALVYSAGGERFDNHAFKVIEDPKRCLVLVGTFQTSRFSCAECNAKNCVFSGVTIE